ncbi:GLPGLI family protein [Puia sp.]|jgi:GLPGLI family protein|uniref:GLPGLI family protein n=1 Tax=Puia sp. TaxID=2045100 RepID=UPI002F403C49
MKMQFLFVVGLLAAFISAKAQKPDTAWLMVHYKFTHIRDTTSRDHPYTENMVLFLGKNASAYRSYDGFVAGQQFKKAYAEAVASSPDGQPRINRHGVGSPTQYYQYPGEQKLFTKDVIMVNEYLIEGPLPAIDWKIGNDTATFGGLHCQKATGHFKGRDYIVWFCPDLPVHSGPWKLNGLPGVIVDARDSKNEVVFAFDGVEKTVPSAKDQSTAGNTDEKDIPPVLRDLIDDPNLIVPPARLVKTTQKEFYKLRETMRKDPAAFAQAINAANDHGDGPKMDHVVVGHRSGPPPPGSVTNNPIELTEK